MPPLECWDPRLAELSFLPLWVRIISEYYAAYKILPEISTREIFDNYFRRMKLNKDHFARMGEYANKCLEVDDFGKSISMIGASKEEGEIVNRLNSAGIFLYAEDLYKASISFSTPAFAWFGIAYKAFQLNDAKDIEGFKELLAKVEQLSRSDQQIIIAFMKSLEILPELIERKSNFEANKGIAEIAKYASADPLNVQTGLIIDVNSTSILTAAIKSIEDIAKRSSAGQLKIQMGFKFITNSSWEPAGHEKEIGALVEFGGQKIGIDVPEVRTFDRSGGVAAFYSAKRLVDGLTNNIFAKAILIMPESTSGEKFQYLLEHNPGLVDFKLNQKQVEDMIRGALLPENNFTPETYKLFNIVTGLSLNVKSVVKSTFKSPKNMEYDIRQAKDVEKGNLEDRGREVQTIRDPSINLAVKPANKLKNQPQYPTFLPQYQISQPVYQPQPQPQPQPQIWRQTQIGPPICPYCSTFLIGLPVNYSNFPVHHRCPNGHGLFGIKIGSDGAVFIYYYGPDNIR